MMQKEIFGVISKAKNFYSTNTKLGLYHMYKGNFADARMRFSMLKTVCKNNSLSLYNLARCYFAEGDLATAKKLFKKAIRVGGREYKEVLFFLDLIEKKHVFQVPSFIVKERFEYAAESYVQDVLVGKKYMCHKFVADEVKSLFAAKRLKTLKVLDLGCGTGVCSHFLKMTDMCGVAHGVDLSSNMLSVAEKCIVNEKPIFEKVYQKDIRDFLEDDRDDEPLLYDLIVAADSVGYTGDLQNIITGCAKILKDDGAIIVIVRSSDKDFEFDQKLLVFSYSAEYMKSIAQKNNLKFTSKMCNFQNSVKGILALYKKDKKDESSS